MTVKVVVADPNVRAGRAVAQGDAANATTETVDVVKQSQTLNYHGRPSTCFFFNQIKNLEKIPIIKSN